MGWTVGAITRLPRRILVFATASAQLLTIAASLSGAKIALTAIRPSVSIARTLVPHGLSVKGFLASELC